MNLADIKANIRRFVKQFALPTTPDESRTGTNSVSDIERTVVVRKSKKRSVQIVCWNCSSFQWISKGSVCHTSGLCGKCHAAMTK